MTTLLATTKTWAEMVKLAHSVFALPFALLATFLAARPGLPTIPQFLLIVLCMVAARSVAMTFNRLVDAEIDARNPRTASRPLPAGLISRPQAWSFVLIAASVFLLGCAGFWWLQENPWPVLLGVPTLGLLCFYSYTKRFTRWSHLVLGLAIAFSPVAAWIAINPATLGWPALLLLLAVTCWIGGFDMIYACQDVDFDRDTGLHSVPSRLGIPAALWLTRFLHLVTVAALIAVGITAELHILYFTGVTIVALLLIVENALVSPTDLSRVNLAFFTVNGIVGLVLGLLGVLDVVLYR